VQPLDVLVMDNHAAPTLAGVQVRVALNAESIPPGHFSKRRGISTPVTVAKVFGDAAPYRIISWKDTGGTDRLIAFGSNAIAFINPLNGRLYARLAAGYGQIWSTPSSQYATAWGLGAPTGSLQTDNVDSDGDTNTSALDGGAYIVAVTGYHSDRNVESPPLFLTSETAVAGAVLSQSLQWLPGPGWSLEWSTGSVACTGATHIRVYIERMHSISPSNKWIPVRVSQYGLHGMRCQREVSGATYQPGDAGRITGLEPSDCVLSYASAVCPYGHAFAWHDGRMFYGVNHHVYYSNPNCPETYAGRTTINSGPVTPILAETEQGQVRGEAHFVVEPTAGTITAIVAYADEMLVLCQYGGWQAIRMGDGISYGHSHHMFAVGCIAPATVCDTPYGAMWLERTGIAVWTGSGAPVVITRNVLDLGEKEVDAGSDLSGAFATYDYLRNEYLCVIPTAAKSGTCTALNTTVVATTNVFTPACVGRNIVIADTGTFPIVRYQSPTRVLVTGTATCTSKTFTIAASKTALVLQAESLERDPQHPDVKLWTFGNTDDLIGIGWDQPNARVVFYYDAATDYGLAPTNAVFADATAAAGTGAETYPFGLDLWLAGDPPQDVIRRPVVTLIADRASAGSQAQTMTALVMGQPVFDEMSRVTQEHVLAQSWAAGFYGALQFNAGVSGKLIHWNLRNEDAYGLDLMQLQFGTKAGSASERKDG